MLGVVVRSSCIVGFCFWLIAAPALALNFRNARVEPLSFSTLGGWTDDDHAVAFDTFLKSCRAILNGTRAMRSARPFYGALFKVCERAVAAGQLDRDHARAFFENNFKPVRVTPAGQTAGFFTGYYETEVDGSRFPSDEYTIPIYAAPAETVRKHQSKVFADLDRTRIEDGALAGKELEICYVKNPVDAFFAQIQGSTRVKLDNGKLLRLNYVASNGMPYTPIGKFLIDRGIVSKEEMSMDKIREFMETNPDEGKELRRKNRSFVFFQEIPLGAHDECIGAQGVPLTPGRSLAVDKRIHIYGTPVWIDAELPIESEKPETKFRHLLFAQDTGSAIVGPARADIYFGHGDEISHIAGRIKQNGQFVMLAPQSVSISGTAVATNVPLPKPRPAMIVTAAARSATETTSSVPARLPRRRP
ncbi:MAG TPA: MltA domain-containing protein [Pseudolabrys sp.]|jgi:membrane-bound lytic murein transglycosylase A|nr:MltA domain-containing protein [Pseudolabrys sp.]